MTHKNTTLFCLSADCCVYISFCVFLVLSFSPYSLNQQASSSLRWFLNAPSPAHSPSPVSLFLGIRWGKKRERERCVSCPGQREQVNESRSRLAESNAPMPMASAPISASSAARCMSRAVAMLPEFPQARLSAAACKQHSNTSKPGDTDTTGTNAVETRRRQKSSRERDWATESVKKKKGKKKARGIMASLWVHFAEN